MTITHRRATAEHRVDSDGSWLDTRCQPPDNAATRIHQPVCSPHICTTVTDSQREKNAR